MTGSGRNHKNFRVVCSLVLNPPFIFPGSATESLCYTMPLHTNTCSTQCNCTTRNTCTHVDNIKTIYVLYNAITHNTQHTMQLYYTQHMYTCRQYKDNLLLCYCTLVWVIPYEWHCTALYTAFQRNCKHLLFACHSFAIKLEICNQKSLLEIQNPCMQYRRIQWPGVTET